MSDGVMEYWSVLALDPPLAPLSLLRPKFPDYGGQAGRIIGERQPRSLSDLSRGGQNDSSQPRKSFRGWTMYKGRRVPEGRMIWGEREIALTTPVSLTPFQPSLWDESSLLRFQAFHAWLRSQVPTGQNPTRSQGFNPDSARPSAFAKAMADKTSRPVIWLLKLQDEGAP